MPWPQHFSMLDKIEIATLRSAPPNLPATALDGLVQISQARAVRRNETVLEQGETRNNFTVFLRGVGCCAWFSRAATGAKSTRVFTAKPFCFAPSLLIYAVGVLVFAR